MSLATIILDHHINNIVEENDILRAKNEKLESLRKIMSTVRICNDNQDDIATGKLVDGNAIPKSPSENNAVPYHQLSSEELKGARLSLSLAGAKATPLRDIQTMKVMRGNQTMGKFFGIVGDPEVFDDALHISYYFRIP